MVEWCWKGPEGAKEVGLEILSSKNGDFKGEFHRQKLGEKLGGVDIG